MALSVALHHLSREIGRAGGGTYIADDISGLDVVAAEPAGSAEIALHIGNIVAIPEFFRHFLIEIQSHPAIFHMENLCSQLFCTDEHIVCHGVSSEKGFAIRPVVVFLCCLDESFHRRQIIVGGSCLPGKFLPVGIVQKKKLRRLCHRENLDAAVPGEIALLNVVLNIFFLFLFGQITGNIGDFSHLIHGIGRIRISGENIRHLIGSDFSLHRGQHVRLQIVDAALAAALHSNAHLLSFTLIELVHQGIEGLQLVAVIIGPYGDCHWIFKFHARIAAAGQNSHHRAHT